MLLAKISFMVMLQMWHDFVLSLREGHFLLPTLGLYLCLLVVQISAAIPFQAAFATNRMQPILI